MERVDQGISPDEFWNKFISPLIPCLIGAWLTESWQARKLWIKNEQINHDFLLEKYGNFKVPVTNCSKNFDCSSMLFRDYLRYLRKKESAETLYCKDWHLAMEDKSFYDWPEHFRNDWLNEYCLKTDFSDSDYRFVYVGIKGTRTPLHRDVLASHSWSSNVGNRLQRISRLKKDAVTIFSDRNLSFLFKFKIVEGLNNI
jgi:hypothetical protein